MIGRRTESVPGWPKSDAQPGDYCKASQSAFPWADEVWLVMAPDGSSCSIGPGQSVHTVAEHHDGSITVAPSIVTRTWHGFLIRGVWT